MTYRVEYTRQAVEDLRRLDRPARGLVYGWVSKNLVHCEDPRRMGDGDPEGGRWRYCVGEYRLIAEIEADKIVILAVNTGLQHAHSPNVFLRSTLRQPVKTALLLAVTALMAFAFVSRAAEYLLIRQETERLGGFYRTAGTLQSTTGDRWADTSEAAAYLEASPYVQLVNTYNHTSAVMEEDFCNADINGTGPGRWGSYFYFYGTLYDWDHENFYFTVDTVLSGYPELIEEGGRVVLFRTTPAKVEVDDLEAAYAQLERGGRYLAAGYYRPNAINKCRTEAKEGEGGREEHTTYARLSLMNTRGFFYPMPEGQEANWADPWLNPEEMDPVEACIQLSQNEQHTLNVIPIKDMSALPIVQDSASGIYLTEGRWLDSQDDEQGRRACVINADLASMRGLELGDTLTLRLQDIPSFFGYLHDLSGEDIRILRSAQTSTGTYEIVGMYSYLGSYPGSEVRNFTYVPASTVPESFQMTNGSNVWDRVFELNFEAAFTANTSAFFPGEVSFVLKNPDDGDRFVSETRSGLASLGFEAVMAENGWANFQAAAGPLTSSSLLSAAIFSVLLLAADCLLAVFYYRMRRKEIAIARAIGVPAKRCVGQAALPLLAVGILGAGAGGWLGWWYTLGNAAHILSVLNAYGEETAAALPRYWMVILCAAALAVSAVAAIGGAAAVASRPVLSLLQGGAAIRPAGRDTAAASRGAAAPSAQPVRSPSSQAVPRTSDIPTLERGTSHVLRFAVRYVLRARLKSTLSILLAVGFTVGLAAIRLAVAASQERISWLYENTPVEAELLQANPTQTIVGGSFIRQETVDALLSSGYVTDVYLEGSASGAVTAPSVAAGGAVSVGMDDKVDMAIRAFTDETVFLSPAGSGGAVTICYTDGWDGGLFAQEWTGDGFPVVLPKAVYDQLGDEVGLACKGFRVCQVAGYYVGEVAGKAGETDPVLIPASAYQQISSIRALSYSKLHVTLAPSLNRELETFTQLVDGISASQGSGMVALRAVIWDEELRLAVAPLENSIELMEVLYPVTLVLSLLVAAGIAVLFVMTSAKEAAILRVLGTSKLHSRVMLALQNVLTSLAGLLLGLLGVLAYTGRTRPELLASLVGASVLCAVLYLLAAIVGAGASAVGVTRRNPLELLQVRE